MNQYHQSEVLNQMEVQIGYNSELKKYFIKLIDIVEVNQSIVYLDESEYREMAHTMLRTLEKVKKEEEEI